MECLKRKWKYFIIIMYERHTPHGKRTLTESKEINDIKRMNTEQSKNEEHEQNQTRNIKGDDQKL